MEAALEAGYRSLGNLSHIRYFIVLISMLKHDHQAYPQVTWLQVFICQRTLGKSSLYMYFKCSPHYGLITAQQKYTVPSGTHLYFGRVKQCKIINFLLKEINSVHYIGFKPRTSQSWSVCPSTEPLLLDRSTLRKKYLYCNLETEVKSVTILPTWIVIFNIFCLSFF